MRKLHKSLILLALILTLSLSCATINNLIGSEEEEGTVPGTAVPTEFTEEVQAVEPTEVRRRELPPTPTPFHVISEDDPRAVLDLSKPDYVDYFDDSSTWFDFDTEGRAAYRFMDGHLEGQDYEPEELYTWWSYSARSADNTYSEISVTNGDCIGKDAVGLVMRVQKDTAAGGYGLEISCDGEWRLMHFREGKSPEIMVDWTASDTINTGKDATNRLGLWGYQPDFNVFINGQQVGKARDSKYSYKYGMFAVYVRAHQTYDLTAIFDDFAFWQLPYQIK
jgi:hypothetical protein